MSYFLSLYGSTGVKHFKVLFDAIQRHFPVRLYYYVVQVYLTKYGTKARQGSTASHGLVASQVSPAIRFDGLHHYAVDAGNRPACAVCTGRPSKKCSKCNVGLHVQYCFEKFHTK